MVKLSEFSTLTPAWQACVAPALGRHLGLEDVTQRDLVLQELGASLQHASPQTQAFVANLCNFLNVPELGDDEADMCTPAYVQALQATLNHMIAPAGIQVKNWHKPDKVLAQVEALARGFYADRQERIHREVAMNQHAIVSASDLQGNITYANDLFCKINDMPREALLGKTTAFWPRACTHPSFSPRCGKPLPRAKPGTVKFAIARPLVAFIG